MRKKRNYGCRITTELSYKGYEMVVLENEQFRLSVLPGKGTDIIELLHKPTDTDFCWFTHLGLRKRETAFSGFQLQYEGGWQEILPNLAGDHWHNGIRLDAYGEVSLTEWSYTVVKDQPEEIVVKFENTLRTMPLHIEKIITMKQNQAGFDIQETLYNESPADIHADWGYHITFGGPFLLPGTLIDLPEAKAAYIVPESGAPGGFETMSCIAGSYRLMNPNGIGAEISWDPQAWPYLWFWRDFGESKAAPYYGNHYNIGLEVFSSPPTTTLQENIDRGTAVCLAPYSQKQSYLGFTVLTITNDGAG